MSPALENNPPLEWRPSCDLTAIRQRAHLLAIIRLFFQEAGVLEVETPLLAASVGTDPYIQFFAVAGGEDELYLQSSPEFAMKRLLAAGTGSIYQICKAFRRGERGRLHNPEFTLLEWYRIGYTLEQMMDETAVLLQRLFEGLIQGQRRMSYGELFRHIVGVEWDAPFAQLRSRASALGLPEAERICGTDRILWLDFLFSHRVQPGLPAGELVFVYDYPAPLAALARLKPEKEDIAERFEVFLNGLELGNGYRELTDAAEQRRRFEAELEARRRAAMPCPKLDESLLAALESGLPECSGVAVGVDRILMLKMGHDSIERVLTFPLRAHS